MHTKKKKEIPKAKKRSFYYIKAHHGENMLLEEPMEHYECCILKNIIKSRHCLNSFAIKIEQMVL